MRTRVQLTGPAGRIAGWVRGIPFPREHGAWGMLLAAAAMAWAHPRVWGWPAAVLVLLFVLAFAIQAPLRAAARGRGGSARGWIITYAVLLLAGTTYLVVEHDLYMLLPAAAVGALLTVADLSLRRWRLHRTVAVRIAGGGALTLVLPGTLCIVHPAWAGYAFVLWGLTLAYFVARLLSVRARFADARGQEGAAMPWRRAWLVVETGIYFALAVLAASGLAGTWVFAAFIPATLVSLRPASGLTPRRIGWQELALLTWFVPALITSYHVGFALP